MRKKKKQQDTPDNYHQMENITKIIILKKPNLLII